MEHLRIVEKNDVQHLLDAPPTLRCPSCGVLASMSAVSVPRYELIQRFQLDTVGLVYRCSACNGPVFAKHEILVRANPVQVSPDVNLVLAARESFELQYLSGAVLEDFNEALTCHAAGCWNAFAAMCRRCIQSVAESLGVDGSSKVQAQLKELHDLGVADDETFTALKEIMLAGHDGAHPHLPSLSAARASILMQLLKDVLYQLFVRPAKIRESSELRKRAQGK